LLKDSSNAIFASRNVLFARAGMLMAQPFDPRNLRLLGGPSAIAEQFAYNAREAYSSYSASNTGVLAYDSRAVSAENRLTWSDRAGRILDTLGEPGIHSRPELSPDGSQLLIAREEPQSGSSDLWLHNFARGVAGRFTFDRASASGVWSPDGARIVFASNRPDSPGLYAKPSNGAGQEELLFPGPQVLPTGWSPDGRFLICQSKDPKTDWDLWMLPMSGDRKPSPLLQTAFAERNGVFSPDGKWIAYDSDQSGRREVYVQALTGSKWQVSASGGADPKWRRDGRELFYVAPDNRLISVSIRSGETIQPGVPTPLFPTAGDGFAVTPNGERFLIPTPKSGQAPAPVTVIINWTAAMNH